MFFDISNGFTRVFFLMQVLGIGKVMVDLYTLGPKNVVVKLFSDIKQENIAEPPLSSSKGTRGGRFKALFRPFKPAKIAGCLSFRTRYWF